MAARKQVSGFVDDEVIGLLRPWNQAGMLSDRTNGGQFGPAIPFLASELTAIFSSLRLDWREGANAYLKCSQEVGRLYAEGKDVTLSSETLPRRADDVSGMRV